jgi:hypothetical protein
MFVEWLLHVTGLEGFHKLISLLPVCNLVLISLSNSLLSEEACLLEVVESFIKTQLDRRLGLTNFEICVETSYIPAPIRTVE